MNNIHSCPNCGAMKPIFKIFCNGYQCCNCGLEEYDLDEEDRTPQ